MGGQIDIAVDAGGSLYRSEGKIYPRETGGRYQRLRTAAVIWLLGMFYLFPWLNWGGRQAVLFDLPARKFYVFGLTFWPQDFIFLALLLIMAGLSLFFFTALAGRLWCGYACPQTVWTETFLWIERWIEGDRRVRMKLDAAPWSREKLLRKGAKHGAWLVFALWTGFTFVGFFTPIRDLGARLWPFDWGGWETFWVLFYALATWGNAGFLREQVCKYMCPYARFQSAMFDRNTLIIAYDERRGEARGARKRGVPSVLALDPGPGTGSRPPLGDCIDCTICVQVCPTGIDIRNGLQYECIACGACIDACDGVMDKIGYPRGLIRYTTQNAVDGEATRILRPRVLVYAGLLLALFAGWAYSIGQRSPLIVDVLRDRNALYRELADGSVENVYTLKIANKDVRGHVFRIEAEAGDGIALMGAPLAPPVEAEAVLTLPVTLRAAPGALHGRRDIRFRIVRADDPKVEAVHDSRFFAPMH